jgi:cobalt-zinc-cadmium efflux system protein
VLVCLLILRSAWGLVRDSWNVLMERAPDDMEIEAIRDVLLDGGPGLLDVHHVHLVADARTISGDAARPGS